MMSAAPDSARAEAARPGASPLLIFWLICSALLWPYVGSALWSLLVVFGPIEGFGLLLVLPPLAGMLPLTALLIYARRWPAALCVPALFPLAVVAQFALIYLMEGLIPTGPRLNVEDATRLTVAAIVAGLAWLALGLWFHRHTVRQAGGAAPVPIGRQVREVAGLAAMFLTVLAVTAGLSWASASADRNAHVRSRVSELLLASSMAKTALAEGMQTHPTWSAEWMSGITIAATGMVASASIGPAGRIIVHGAAPTSFSVVTLTPAVTTDNKLVWSCTGEPAQYMPASCR